MTVQLDAGLAALHKGARNRQADPLVERRIADVQSFLAGELAGVEALLGEALGQGPEPAPSASRHLIERGGKRVRPMALLLGAQCFGGSGPLFRELAAVVELVHSATLLHDDVVDEGMERRGAVTARRRFGNGVSVLAGDLLLVTALERARAVSTDVLTDLVFTLRRLVEGEVIQLRGRTELDMREETYFRVLSDKTASLFAFATRTGGFLAGASAEHVDALSSYGESLGIAFQLVDDLLDYSGTDTGKNLFADLAEGKLTLPLVLAVERDPALGTLVQQLHQGNPEVTPLIIEQVIASGACDEVRQRAHEVTLNAQRALETLPPSPARLLLSLVAAEMTGRLS